MKRITAALILCALLISALAACGKTTETPGLPSSDAAADSKPENISRDVSGTESAEVTEPGGESIAERSGPDPNRAVVTDGIASTLFFQSEFFSENAAFYDDGTFEATGAWALSAQRWFSIVSAYGASKYPAFGTRYYKATGRYTESDGVYSLTVDKYYCKYELTGENTEALRSHIDKLTDATLHPFSEEFKKTVMGEWGETGDAAGISRLRSAEVRIVTRDDVLPGIWADYANRLIRSGNTGYEKILLPVKMLYCDTGLTVLEEYYDNGYLKYKNKGRDLSEEELKSGGTTYEYDYYDNGERRSLHQKTRGGEKDTVYHLVNEYPYNTYDENGRIAESRYYPDTENTASPENVYRKVLFSYFDSGILKSEKNYRTEAGKYSAYCNKEIEKLSEEDLVPESEYEYYEDTENGVIREEWIYSNGTLIKYWILDDDKQFLEGKQADGNGVLQPMRFNVPDFVADRREYEYYDDGLVKKVTLWSGDLLYSFFEYNERGEETLHISYNKEGAVISYAETAHIYEYYPEGWIKKKTFYEKWSDGVGLSRLYSYEYYPSGATMAITEYDIKDTSVLHRTEYNEDGTQKTSFGK